MKLSRRQFLVLAGGAGLAATVLSYTHFSKKNSSSGVLIGGGKMIQDEEVIYYLASMDLSQIKEDPLFYKTHFLPHGLCYHPQQKHRLVVFEKKGPGACEIDLIERKVVRKINTDPTRHFYGHGSYSSDGKHLYSTETILTSEEGVIVQRNSETMEVQGFFPTYGANPHDCVLIENGTILAITNGGRAQVDDSLEALPCVSYVDIKTQKLIKKYKMLDRRFNTGHLAVSQQGELVVSSAPHPALLPSAEGALSMPDQEGVLVNLNTPLTGVQLKSETLSLCIDEVRGVVAATSPAGNNISFWDLKSKKLISTLEIPHPRGIVQTLDQKNYIVSYGEKASLVFIDAENFKKTNTEITQAGYSGSHLYTLPS